MPQSLRKSRIEEKVYKIDEGERANGNGFRNGLETVVKPARRKVVSGV